MNPALGRLLTRLYKPFQINTIILATYGCHMTCAPSEKARWGRDGGLGGKGNPSRASRGVSLPPNTTFPPEISR